MNNRPRSITIIGWIFIALGAITLLFGLLPPIDGSDPPPGPEPGSHEAFGHAFVHVVRIIAIVCGLGLLYGFNWARWLLVVWIGGHVVIGFHHSLWGSVVHVALFGIVLVFLFRPQASAYFRPALSRTAS